METQNEALKKENENLKVQIASLEEVFIRKTPHDELLEQEKRERDRVLELERRRKEREDRDKEERENSKDPDDKETENKVCSQYNMIVLIPIAAMAARWHF